MKEQHIHNREVFRKVIKLNLEVSVVHFNTGQLRFSADGRMQQCNPVITAWMAANFENIDLH
jgi:hypothetical protein